GSQVRLHALHAAFQARNAVVEGEESFDEHVARVEDEIIGSKRRIEKELDKPVRFLCWPHGGNSPAVHAVARQAGHVATTVGRWVASANERDRIPRTGTGWPLGTTMRRLKFDAKMGAAHGRQPYRALAGLNAFRHRLFSQG
ncbi:MAG TPA: polysaccharide deacetylase family protein, partial [Flavobacteriales bacterium]|nr:polysaccharide deacetylase family protein [Flavobacteriales bacterium]